MLGKRPRPNTMGPDDGTNPVHRQGGVEVPCWFDVQHISSMMNRGVDADATIAYPVPKDESVFDVVERQPLFVVVPSGESGPRVGDSGKALVVGALNGMGVDLPPERLEEYKDDPEMLRASVQSQVRFIGFGMTTAPVSRGTAQIGITVTLAGLQTGVAPPTQIVRPGDLVELVVPPPGQVHHNGRNQRTNDHSRKKLDDGRVTLEFNVVSTETPAALMERHVHEIIRDDAMWKRAMGGYYTDAAAYRSAATAIINSGIAKCLLGLRPLLASGLLSAGPLLQANTITVPVGPSGVRTALGVVANPFGLANATPSKVLADRVILGLAQWLRVVGSVDVNGTIPTALSALKREMAATICFDARRPNADVEFGSEVVATGDNTFELLPTVFRTENGIRVDLTKTAAGRTTTGTPAGDFATVQENHLRADLRAMHYAILQTHSRVAGKAVTGSNPLSSSAFKFAQGVNRP